MDTVAPGSRREVLRQKVERAQDLLQRAASAATVHGDPVAAQLQAMLYSLGAMTDIHDAIFAMQTEFLKALKTHTENVTKLAPEIARASATSIATELGPQLLKAALPTMRQTLRTLRIRSVIGVAGALVILLLVAGAYLYTAGVTLGRTQGENSAHAMQAAMKYNPEGALIWGKLMTYNDPVKAMALCEKDITVGPGGRRSCFLPVWIDPIPGTTP